MTIPFLSGASIPLFDSTIDSLNLPLAHVSYVVDPEKIEALSGQDWGYILSPLQDPFYLMLIAITLIVTVIVFAACELCTPLRNLCRNIHDRLISYQDFIPMILRISLGVALIVAGTKQALILPNVAGGWVSTIEVVLGFFLLVGFMVRLSGLAALGIFLFGLYTSHYLLGTMETAAAAILVAAYGSKRPCIDDVLEVDALGSLLEPLWKQLQIHASFILRIALGSTLIWLAVSEKALNPRLCEAVVIDYHLEKIIPVSTAMWVFAVGVIELAVGLVLVLGLFTRSFSLIAFLVLTLSFFYFRENVAGHVTFFGALIVLMITGADTGSLDSLIAKKTRNVHGTKIPYAE